MFTKESFYTHKDTANILFPSLSAYIFSLQQRCESPS